MNELQFFELAVTFAICAQAFVIWAIGYRVKELERIVAAINSAIVDILKREIEEAQK